MKDAHLMDPDELAQRFFAGEGPVQSASHHYTREELVRLVEENVRQIVEAVRGMTPAQLAYRPPGVPSGPDSSHDEEHFDTSQIVTHLAAGIAFHWWGMTRALGHDRPEFPRPPEGAKRTAIKGGTMGAGGWSGASAEELVRLLEEMAGRFLNYVGTLPKEFNEKARSNLFSFKEMTPHDWLFLEVVHTAMHLKQIKVMQAQPDYPKE